MPPNPATPGQGSALAWGLEGREEGKDQPWGGPGQCRNAPWVTPVPVSRALPSVLAQTWGWQPWEDRHRAWRGAAEPPPPEPHRGTHKEQQRGMSGWAGRCSLPHGVMQDGRPWDRGAWGQAWLQQAVTRNTRHPPCPGPRELQRKGRAFAWIPGTQHQTLTWKWGGRPCCVHVEQSRGADAKWDEAASHPWPHSSVEPAGTQGHATRPAPGLPGGEGVAGGQLLFLPSSQSRNPPASSQDKESPRGTLIPAAEPSGSYPHNPPHPKPAGCLTNGRDCFDSLRQETALWDHRGQPPTSRNSTTAACPGLAPQLASGSAGVSLSLSGGQELCSQQLCLGLHLLQFPPAPNFTAGAGKPQLGPSSGLETAPASQVPVTSWHYVFKSLC